MTSLRQIEANRRNARLSAGPQTEEGKTRSRGNALRHGLTAETVIAVFEDSTDYAAFELRITTEYEPETAVERELVLRLASLLWRLRRATALEVGLFTYGAHLETDEEHNIPDYIEHFDTVGAGNVYSTTGDTNTTDNLTRTLVELFKLPSCPLDRLSRYEARLWRQVRQAVLTLEALRGRNMRRSAKFRPRF